MTTLSDIVTRDGMGGEGTLVHDIVVRRADGSLGHEISRWRVRLIRVACDQVPRAHRY